MASATRRPAVTKTTVVTVEPEAIVLTLSPLEAAALYVLVGQVVTGDNLGARGLTDNIYHALPKGLGKRVTARLLGIRRDHLFEGGTSAHFLITSRSGLAAVLADGSKF